MVDETPAQTPRVRAMPVATGQAGAGAGVDMEKAKGLGYGGKHG
jgi:hypothetical protein